MNLRRILLLQHQDKVAVGGPDSVGAQLELLEILMEWLPRRYPTRFAVDWAAGTVETLTPGYTHTFRISDYAHRPIVLCGLLVQEELLLMREEICPPDQDIIEGGVGKQHRCVSGVSTFSFALPPKYQKIMSQIHHPHVPGFLADLQRQMTSFFTDLEYGGERWRSNFGFSGSSCDNPSC